MFVEKRRNSIRPELRAAVLFQRCSERSVPVPLFSERGRASRRFLIATSKDGFMRRPVLFAFAMLSLLSSAAAQTTTPAPPQEAPKECPPGAGPNAPTVGDAKGTLSERLASSKGIICPPAGVDPSMQQQPQEGGSLKVIPPPGSPGGNQQVQPK
jgi:hypothetical protein